MRSLAAPAGLQAAGPGLAVSPSRHRRTWRSNAAAASAARRDISRTHFIAQRHGYAGAGTMAARLPPGEIAPVERCARSGRDVRLRATPIESYDADELSLCVAADGCLVSFHYLGTVVDTGVTIQTTWDREDGPIQYVIGQMTEATSGPERIMLAFDKALRGTIEGTQKTIRLSPDEAYGELRADLIRQVDMETMKTNAPGSETMDKGDNLQLPNGAKGVVMDRNDENMTINFNHPLAGKEVEFELTVIEVEPVKASAAVSHILVDSEDVATRLKLEVLAGADFGELAGEYSTCGSRSTQGVLGVVLPGQMVPEFDEVVWSCEPGVVQGPVQTQFGYHLILVTERSGGQGDDAP